MTTQSTRRDVIRLGAAAALLAATPIPSLPAAAAPSEGPVAALSRRYFAVHRAYEDMPNNLPHEEIAARESLLGDEMHAVDEGLVASHPTSGPEAMALLEVARSDFDQFHRKDDGSFDDPGEAIVFNALDSALRVLRSLI